mmetsp:Transcript_76000/g.219482  ORF Transcript_76000/g.219482 Transcript_76000/m.219482 type:complete len:203 (+) Transcript_76000:354-962(+)
MPGSGLGLLLSCGRSCFRTAAEGLHLLEAGDELGELPLHAVLGLAQNVANLARGRRLRLARGAPQGLLSGGPEGVGGPDLAAEDRLQATGRAERGGDGVERRLLGNSRRRVPSGGDRTPCRGSVHASAAKVRRRCRVGLGEPGVRLETDARRRTSTASPLLQSPRGGGEEQPNASGCVFCHRPEFHAALRRRRWCRDLETRR